MVFTKLLRAGEGKLLRRLGKIADAVDSLSDETAELTDAELRAKTDEFKVAGAPVTEVDLHGTYLFKARPFDPNAKTEEKPDYRMVGVVFESKGGTYYMRLVGPAKSVEKDKKEFDDWLKNFK